MRTITTLVIMLGFTVSASAAEPKPVKLDDVPFSVKIAASIAAKSVDKWESAGILRGRDLVKVYQIIGKTKAGGIVVVHADDEGMILDVIVKIVLQDVPEAVSKAVEKKYPSFKPSTVTAVGFTDVTVVGYRFEGADADGKIQVILASVDGTNVLIEGRKNDSKNKGEDR